MRKLTQVGIYSGILGGFLFDDVQVLKPAIPWLLGALLFFNFSRIDFYFKRKDFSRLLWFPLFCLGLLPFLTSIFLQGMGENFRAGIFLISISPVAIASPVIADFIHADRRLVALGLFLYNLLAPLIYPLLIHWHLKGQEITVPPSQIFGLALLVGLPLVLSLLTKKLKQCSILVNQAGRYAGPGIFILVIMIAMGAAKKYLVNKPAQELFFLALAVFSLAILLYVSGFFLGKLSGVPRSTALFFGHKNSGLALWVALAFFHEEAILPIILYIISHHVINGFLMQIWHKHPGSESAESPH